MATEKERQEFIARFCAEYNGKLTAAAGALEKHGLKMQRSGETYTLQQCIEAARALLRHARTHGRLAVEYCNGPQHLNGPSPYDWQTQPEQHRAWINGNSAAAEAWETQRERKALACANRIIEICNQFNLPVHLGGDPRGYTVKVKLPSGAANTWGGSADGWGVPQ